MNIHPHTRQAYDLFHAGTLAFARAERQGIRVDLSYVKAKKDELTRKIMRLERNFKDTNFFKHWQHSSNSTVNINSDVQLSNYLYKKKKIQPTRVTRTGKGSTDEEALKQLNIPELNDLLYIRKLKKMRDYLDAFEREQVDGFIHPHFNLHLVKTFRSSSDSPNFQNIPKRDEEARSIVRKALYPRKGHQLVEFDYSGLEVRIAACYHKDPTMVRYISDAKSDMHADMAKQLFFISKFDKKEHDILRQAAKNGFVFPQFYGDYYGNCAYYLLVEWGKLSAGSFRTGQGIIIDDISLADHLIDHKVKNFDQYIEHVKRIEEDFWNKRFPVYKRWKERWFHQYQKNGYVDLLTGFRCSGVMSKKDAINYPVQGAAFHCLLWSFIELTKLFESENLDSKIIGQIHDSMIMDVNPTELAHIIRTTREITCDMLPAVWKWINVPLDIDVSVSPVDESWLDKVA